MKNEIKTLLKQRNILVQMLNKIDENIANDDRTISYFRLTNMKRRTLKLLSKVSTRIDNM